jgi:toxin ParE1/3/4
VKTYALSKAAESDLEAILDYTVDTWGAKQATAYLEGFVECFTRLANSPGLGRACDDLKSGLKRVEYKKHVVFFRTTRSGIRILRILHQRMLPGRYLS